MDFKNLIKIGVCWKLIFEILIILRQHVGPIGSAVLTFTDSRTHKQSILIDFKSIYQYKSRKKCVRIFKNLFIVAKVT